MYTPSMGRWRKRLAIGSGCCTGYESLPSSVPNLPTPSSTLKVHHRAV